MAITENRVAGLQERLKEVMRCEQLNKQQFMKVTDISNIGRKLDGKVAITKVDISKMKHSLLVNDQWFETGIGPMYLPEKLEEKTRELNRISGTYPHLHINDDLVKEEIEREEESIKDKNAQLIQIINAKDEIIKAKESEIRLLRKFLADNGIEV